MIELGQLSYFKNDIKLRCKGHYEIIKKAYSSFVFLLFVLNHNLWKHFSTKKFIVLHHLADTKVTSFS